MMHIKSLKISNKFKFHRNKKTDESSVHPGIFDLHVDGSTPEVILDRGKQFEEMHQIGEVDRLPNGNSNLQDISLPGMLKGGYVGALVNSFPISHGGKAPSHDDFWEAYRKHADVYERAAKDNPEKVAIVKNKSELLDASLSKKMAMIKSIEGLYVPSTEKGLETIEKLANDGVRSFGILWNIDNGIGTSWFTEANGIDIGLTDFGKEVVKLLNDTKGVVIDLSHSSAKTTEDVLKIVGSENGKIIASHAGVRGRNMNRRNLTLETASEIGKNGIIGIPFHRNFVIPEKDRTDPDVISTTNDVINSIIEMRKILGGSENIGIGTDFGGLGKRTATLGLEDCSTFAQYLFEKMKESKEFKDEEIEGIFSKNALRFFAQALPEN